MISVNCRAHATFVAAAAVVAAAAAAVVAPESADAAPARFPANGAPICAGGDGFVHATAAAAVAAAVVAAAAATPAAATLVAASCARRASATPCFCYGRCAPTITHNMQQEHTSKRTTASHERETRRKGGGRGKGIHSCELFGVRAYVGGRGLRPFLKAAFQGMPRRRPQKYAAVIRACVRARGGGGGGGSGGS